MDKAVAALLDAATAALERGVKITRLTWVENQLWKMAETIAQLEGVPPQDSRRSLPQIKSSTSAPSLTKKQDAVSAAYGTGSRTRSRVAAPAQEAKQPEQLPPGSDVGGGRQRMRITASRPSAEAPSPSDYSPTAPGPSVAAAAAAASPLPKPSVEAPPAVSSIAAMSRMMDPGSPESGSPAAWKQRHRRIHRDEPIRLDEVQFGRPPRPPRASRAVADIASAAAKASEKDVELAEKNNRQMAYLIGSLRDSAQASGGEVDRKTFNKALVTHELLSAEEDVAASDAPDQLFAAIDVDNSGRLSVGELETALYGLLSDDQSVEAVQRLLALGSDMMSLPVRTLNEKLRGQVSKVIALFKEWDRDGDGSISRYEFRKALPQLGLTGFTNAEIDALFDSYDPDGSGELSFRELFRTLRHDPQSYGGKAKAPKPRRNKVESEPVADLQQLLRSTKLDYFKMQVEQEVLDWTRKNCARPANPSINMGLFAGLTGHVQYD